MPAATETRKITINVDAGSTTPQLKAIADAISGMNKNTKALADAFGLVKAGSASFLGGLGIRELLNFSDEIETLNNRLLALTGDQEKATDLLGKLQTAAQETNSSLSATSDLYTRMSLALKDANINADVMIEFTKTLVNTYRLSGSSAEDAAAKVTSLSYAMQQGGLKGRELRTVLRENTELGQLLKTEFGGNLLEAANNGFITTAKLMEVIYKNMGQVNAQASTLGATFNQSLTKVFDALKVQLFDLNRQLGASGEFGKAAQYAIDNMNTIVAVLTVLAVATIPTLIPQVIKMAASFGLLSEPVILITALGVALLSTNTELEKFLNPIDRLNIAIYKLDLSFIGAINTISKYLAYLPGFAGGVAEIVKELTDMDLKNSQQQIQTLTFKALELSNKVKDGGKEAQTTLEKWLESIKNAGKIKLDKTPAELLAELNAQFTAGSVTVDQYNEKLQKVSVAQASKEFRTGHKDLEQFNEAMEKVKTTNFNLELRRAQITFAEFDTATRGLALDKLNRQLQSGAISLEQYNKQLAAVSDKFAVGGAFRTGLQDYLSAIGTTTQQVATAITNAFKGVEDVFLEFTKTGTFNFNKFAQGILDDLERIIIRATIIAPLAQGILNGISFPSSGATVPQGGPGNYAVQPNAMGNVFNRGLVPFASGGVFTSPTAFGFGGGKMGVMGEAGAEAVVPLARGSDGKLGVGASITPVTINVINQNGSQVSQTETTGPSGEKTIELLIQSKVKEGLAAGKFDKAFKQSFGLNRRGS